MDAKNLLVGQMSMQEIEVDMITDSSSNKKTSNDTSIAVISKNTIPHHPLVYQCPSEFELNNWEIKKTLKVTKYHKRVQELKATSMTLLILSFQSIILAEY